MKKIATLVLVLAMVLTLAVSASAYFEAEEAFGEVKFEIGKQTTAWNPDGTITDGEYFKVAIDPTWLSYAINDTDTDAGLEYAKATMPELYMSWDETYVYTATRYEVTKGHENLWDGDPASMWYSGAVQFNYANFDEVASEYRLEYGVGLSSDTGDTLYTVWADGCGSGYEPTADDAKVWLDGNTLTYETRVPWEAFADEDNTGYKEGNGFNTTFVWSIGEGQDYVHIQLAEGCTGNGKHAENMAQVTLVGAAPIPYTPVGEVTVPYVTPEIDGVINDGEYPEEGKVVLNQSNLTALGWIGEVPAENSIDLYCGWDNNNFYLAGNVTDPAFMYSDIGQYNGDAFQVSLNIGNVFKTDEGYDRAIFYSWGLQEEGTIDVIRQESANNDTIFEIGKGQKTDTGWVFEVALSLEMLADDAYQKGGEEAIPEPGMPIGGLFCYLDHDDVGSLVNAFGTSTDEVMGWDPDAHGITFMFAAKDGAAAPAETAKDLPENSAFADIVVTPDQEFYDDPDTLYEGGSGQPIQYVEGYGVGYSSLNDQVIFPDIDFGENGADKMIINFSNGGADVTTLAVYVDEKSDTPAATYTIENTGGWEATWAEDFEADIAVPAGKHTIIIEFTNSNSGSFTYIRFNEAPAAPTFTYPASGAEGSIINGSVIGNATGWDGTEASGAASVFDGNPATFFDPLGVGDGFCGIDAGESYILDKVVILSRENWNDRFDGAKIQGSNDGENWTTLWTSETTGTYPDYYTVTEFENNTGYSQFRYFNDKNHGDVAEVEFYGAPGKALPDIENYAIGAKVTVTSTETDDFPGELAVDGDLSTRWASAYTDDEAITIDLGKAKAVNYIALYWETAMSEDYEVYGSLDENDLQAKTLAKVTGNASKDNVLEFDTEAVRYITIHASKRATDWGNSLYEILVSGEGDAEVPAADEVLDQKANPNTFDFGIIAAVASVISLAGFAVSKKRH